MHLYQVQTPNSGRAGVKLWLWTSAFFSNSLPNPPTLFFPHRKASVLLQPTPTTSSSFPKSGSISQATNRLFQQHWYCCQRTSDHFAEILKGLCQAGSPTTSIKCANCSSENIHYRINPSSVRALQKSFTSCCRGWWARLNFIKKFIKIKNPSACKHRRTTRLTEQVAAVTQR